MRTMSHCSYKVNIGIYRTALHCSLRVFIILLGVHEYSYCWYASRASPWPLNQDVWIGRRGTCFWAGQSCMCAHVANEVLKVWEGRQSVRITLKDRTAQNAKIWSFISRRPRALFSSLGAAALSRTYRSRRGLHGVKAAFTLCLLRFRLSCLQKVVYTYVTLSFSLFLAPLQLLPFWRRDR